jgi:hypothetical protein
MPDGAFEVTTLSAAQIPEYITFARESWGMKSIQSSPAFLTWLYSENPNTRGMENDLIIITNGNIVVGAHHRMRIPWCMAGTAAVVSSLHDLMVLPAYRALKGQSGLVSLGLRLMMAAFEGESQVTIFGLSEVANKIYEGLKVPRIEMFWLQKVRSRFQAGMQMVVSRTGFLPGDRHLGDSEVRSAGYDVSVIAFPSCDHLREALTISPAAETYVAWDIASFRWRYFHPIGPKNLLFLIRKEGRLIGRAVLSIGCRKGVVVGRIVDLVINDAGGWQTLLKAVDEVSSSWRIPVLFIVTGSSEIADRLRLFGWSNRSKPARARWFTARGKARPEQPWIVGGAWDFGCDTQLGDSHAAS